MDDEAGEQRRRSRPNAPTAQVTLPPALTSVPRARHWVASFLSDTEDELRETAVLLTSELVTNAVLHTAGDITVTAEITHPGIRVEVADGSPEAPSPKDYGRDAATGRGLLVLDSLADEWGTELDGLGKVVWFELGGGTAASGTKTHATETLPAAPPAGEDLTDMALLGVPVAMLVRAQAMYEELFREFRLVIEGDPTGPADAIQRRLLDLVDELGTRFAGFTTGADAAWRDAVARGDEWVDLHYRLPRAVGPLCRHYDGLLDEADEFCRAAALLTLAPPRDVVCLRKWILAELAEQADGAAAVAFADSAWSADARGGR